MATTNQVIPAGLQKCSYGIVSGGYCLGGAGAVTAGDANGAAMGQWYGAKTVPVSVNEPDQVAATGDDTTLAQFQFDAADLPNGVLEFAIAALDIEAAFQNTSTVDVAEIRMGGLQPIGVTRPDLCLIFQSQAKSYDSGTKGAARWWGRVVPVGNVSPLSGDQTEKTPVTSRYAVTAQQADAYPWGATFSKATEGFEQAPIIPFTADNPITLHVFRGDAAEDTFVLGLAPVSTAKTAVFINGLRQYAGWTLTTATKTIVFGSAPASNALVHVWYEYDPTA